MSRRRNGGVIGAYVNTTSTSAPGVWSMNEASVRAGRINTGGAVDVWSQASDASFSSVVGLYHFDTVLGAGTVFTFADASSAGMTLSLNAANISQSVAKFGPGALNCAGANTATHANSANYTFGTADFTVEGWVYISSAATGVFFDFRAGGNQQPIVYFTSSLDVRFFAAGADRITSSANAMVLNTFAHVAAARVSGTTKLFVNGTQVGSSYTDANNYAAGTLMVGAAFNSTSQLSGAIDEMRITKGVGRYSSNFTAPTAPFPDS